MNTQRGDDRLRYFICLWAMVIYCEIVGNFVSSMTPVVTLAILLVWCKPRSLIFFTLLLAADFAHKFIFSNQIYINNILIEAFFDFSILLVILYFFLNQKRLQLNQGHIYSTLAPMIRIAVIGFYFFAFFGKLNKDFINPQYSVAAFFLDVIQRSYYPEFIKHFVALPWMKPLAIAVTLISEGSLPFLLIFKPTRHVAILWAVVFHFFIGFVPYMNVCVFSSLMLGLQFAFLSNEAFEWMCHFVEGVKKVIDKAIPTFPIRCMVIAVFVYLPRYLFCSHGRNFYYLLSVWLPVYIFVGGVFIASILMTRKISHHTWVGDSGGFFISKPQFPSLMAIAFILVIGTSPYLGTQIGGGFNLFSNSRFWGPTSNHLLIPSSWSIFKEDFIKVLDSNSMAFRRYVGTPYLLPTYAFRRIASRIKGPFYVHILYKNKDETINKIPGKPNTDPLLKPLTWLEYKFIYLYIYDVREHVTPHPYGKMRLSQLTAPVKGGIVGQL